MHDVVGTKRRGHDGGPLTMLWQVELASVGEMQVKEESETGHSMMHLAGLPHPGFPVMLPICKPFENPNISPHLFLHVMHMKSYSCKDI